MRCYRVAAEPSLKGLGAQSNPPARAGVCKQLGLRRLFLEILYNAAADQLVPQHAHRGVYDVDFQL
jgi:hypothetical protein